MFTLTEIEKLKEKFKEEVLIRNKQARFIWSGLSLFSFIVIVGILLIFPNIFSGDITAWIIPVYASLSFIVFLAGYFISFNYISEKPTFMYLYDEIYDKINNQEGFFLEYIAYDKENKSFNKNGGLFPRNASIYTRRHVSGFSDESIVFNIFDTTIKTSTGNGEQIHFNGIYYILDKKINTSIQIRTNGSPKFKGIKFNRLDDFKDLRVYKKEEEVMMNIDHILLNFMKELLEKKIYVKLYLSVVENQIHLALWNVSHPARKQKVVTESSVKAITEYFMSELALVNEIGDLDT